MSDVNKQLLEALAGYDNIVRIVLNGLRRDYEERGLMIRKEFHDELSSAHAKACDAVFDAKQKMKNISAAEQVQRAEPVARDVLMAFGKEVADEISRCLPYPGRADISTIADRYATQPPAVAVPDGYALVPIEPTPQMLMAADRTQGPDADIYRAMLAAAKKP